MEETSNEESFMAELDYKYVKNLVLKVFSNHNFIFM